MIKLIQYTKLDDCRVTEFELFEDISKDELHKFGDSNFYKDYVKFTKNYDTNKNYTIEVEDGRIMRVYENNESFSKDRFIIVIRDKVLINDDIENTECYFGRQMPYVMIIENNDGSTILQIGDSLRTQIEYHNLESIRYNIFINNIEFVDSLYKVSNKNYEILGNGKDGVEPIQCITKLSSVPMVEFSSREDISFIRDNTYLNIRTPSGEEKEITTRSLLIMLFRNEIHRAVIESVDGPIIVDSFN